MMDTLFSSSNGTSFLGLLPVEARDGSLASLHSQEILHLPVSFTTKDKISCSKNDVDKIISHLLDEFPNSDTSDGLKIVIDPKNWVMMRPSGTEPIIRIYGESDTQANLDSLITKYIKKIKEIISR